MRPIYLYDAEKTPTTVKGCVEILARSNNKVKLTREKETSNQNSLSVVRSMYRTRATQPLRAPLRVTKQVQPLTKKRLLYIQNIHNIQNTNVRSSGMHKTSMFKITDPPEYSMYPVNHIPALLRTHPKGILPHNTQRYGKYFLQRT